MGNKLAAVLALVEDQAITFFRDTELPGCFVGNSHHLAKEFGSGVMHTKNMSFWKNYKMDWCLRTYIFFDYKVIILINNSLL